MAEPASMTPKQIAAIVTAAAKASLLVAFPSGATPTGVNIDALARAIGNNAAQAIAFQSDADTPE
ncbi:MAG: hypothetical protein V4479_07605 [Actinomycetota bacterium]